MPDPVKEKEPTVEIVEQPKAPEKEFEVDLGTKEPKTAPQTPEEIAKLQKSIAYQTRKFEQAMEQINNLAQVVQTLRTSQPQVTQTQPVGTSQPPDELDLLAEKDWKQAVRVLGKQAARELFEEIRKEQTFVNEKLALENEVDTSRKRVLSRYPTIEDETTMEHQVYREVMNEDPAILKNPRGPEIAMYRMEEKLREQGVTPLPYRDTVDKEVQRRTRVGSASLPVGRPATGEKKYVMTSDEKEFCDGQGIPYARYVELREKGDKAFKEGVESNG